MALIDNVMDLNAKNIEPWKAPATRKRTTVITVVVVAALLAGAYVAYEYVVASKSTAATTADTAPVRAVPVIVSAARKADMNIYLTGLGTVTPLKTVNVHTRVNGQIDKIDFTEGQIVHVGDPIIEIDPRPYQVQLEQAQGQQIKDQASLDNDRAQLTRLQSASTGAVAQSQIDAQTATVHQDEGNVKSDQAMIDSAKLNLVYCKITAPIDGRIGLRQVDEGNIVQTTDLTPVAVITQIQPIAVLFSLEQDLIPQILPQISAGKTLTVDAWNRDITAKLTSGKLVALDSAIDPTTGMLRFKAIFDNKDLALYPSQFVNARLLVNQLHNVVEVPPGAIQRGVQSTFVYVVKPAPATTGGPTTGPADGGKSGTGIVEMRTITEGATSGDWTVIESGISPGDIVVTDGVDKIQQGSKVSYDATGRGNTTQPSVTAGPASDLVAPATRPSA
jgi:multidrug efflux system membrane fusion protein